MKTNGKSMGPNPAPRDVPVLLGGGNLLTQPPGDGFSQRSLLDDVRAHHLARAMRETNGGKTHAADLLGYRNDQTLDHQLRRLGVAWKSN